MVGNDMRVRDLSQDRVERQIGYLIRAVEDISGKIDCSSSKEEEYREKLISLKEEITSRHASLESQVSLLTTKVDEIEKSLKRFVVGAGVVVAVGGAALGKLEPSAIASALLSIVSVFI